MSKDFKQHFHMLYNKFINKENFAFSRFSDGELRIMQNKTLVLANDHYNIGGKKVKAFYHPEDHKNFDPTKHQFYRQKLMEAYKHKQHNYYVGLSCRCCVGKADFDLMLDWYEGDVNSDNLTWANLWVNGNFPLFRDKMVPEFSKRDIVYIVNENANIDGLPFKVKKDFRVGKNCIINDYYKIDKISNWIKNNNIENHVFLFSASSLSNFMIHQLYSKYPNNTYIDVGTTLNDFIKLSTNRGYLSGKNRKICLW